MSDGRRTLRDTEIFQPRWVARVMSAQVGGRGGRDRDAEADRRVDLGGGRSKKDSCCQKDEVRGCHPRRDADNIMVIATKKASHVTACLSGRLSIQCLVLSEDRSGLRLSRPMCSASRGTHQAPRPRWMDGTAGCALCDFGPDTGFGSGTDDKLAGDRSLSASWLHIFTPPCTPSWAPVRPPNSPVETSSLECRWRAYCQSLMACLHSHRTIPRVGRECFPCPDFTARSNWVVQSK